MRTIFAVDGRSTDVLPNKIAFKLDFNDGEEDRCSLDIVLISIFPFSDLSLSTVFCLVKPIVFSLLIPIVFSRWGFEGFSFGTVVFSLFIWTLCLLVFGRSCVLLVTPWTPLSALFVTERGCFIVSPFAWEFDLESGDTIVFSWTALPLGSLNWKYRELKCLSYFDRWKKMVIYSIRLTLSC